MKQKEKSQSLFNQVFFVSWDEILQRKALDGRNPFLIRSSLFLMRG